MSPVLLGRYFITRIPLYNLEWTLLALQLDFQEFTDMIRRRHIGYPVPWWTIRKLEFWRPRRILITCSKENVKSKPLRLICPVVVKKCFVVWKGHHTRHMRLWLPVLRDVPMEAASRTFDRNCQPLSAATLGSGESVFLVCGLDTFVTGNDCGF